MGDINRDTRSLDSSSRDLLGVRQGFNSLIPCQLPVRRGAELAWSGPKKPMNLTRLGFCV